MRRSALAIALGCLVATAVPALAGTALAPHRAVYDVTLDRASDRSGIRDIKGRMVYEMTGSHCSGYAVRFRFFQNVKTARREYTSDHRSTTFEDLGRGKFDFVTRSYFNGSLEREVKGSAERKPEGVWVSLAKPGEKAVALKDAVFTAQHMSDLIEAAKRGETIVGRDVFDGSEDGDEVLATTAVIGPRKELDANEAEPLGKVGPHAWWPVSVSYFDLDDSAGEKLPVYQVSYAMHENGVSRRLKMRYADYALDATLKDIEYLKVEACE